MDKQIITELARNIYKLTLFFPNREPLRYKLRETVDQVIYEFLMEKKDYLDNICRYLEVIDSYLDIAASQDWTAPARINALKEDFASLSYLVKQSLSRESDSKISETLPHSAVDRRAAVSIDVIEKPVVCPAPQKNIGNVLPSVALKSEIILPEAALRHSADLPVGGITTPDAESRLSDDLPEDGINNDFLTSGQIARQNRIAEFLKEKGSAQVWEIQKIFPQVSKRTIRRDFRSMLEQGLIERTGERNTTAYKMKISLS